MQFLFSSQVVSLHIPEYLCARLDGKSHFSKIKSNLQSMLLFVSDCVHFLVEVALTSICNGCCIQHECAQYANK